MVDKVSCVSTGGGASRSTVNREGESKVHVYSSEDDSLSSP